MNIDLIRALCSSGNLRWTNHMMIRLIQRNISIDDVQLSLMSGEIIEEYPNDYPYPSSLILGLTLYNKRLHVVCGIGNNELWLITAYYPSLDEWDNDYKIRKG